VKPIKGKPVNPQLKRHNQHRHCSLLKQWWRTWLVACVLSVKPLTLGLHWLKLEP